jgi:hypothetical protein
MARASIGAFPFSRLSFYLELALCVPHHVYFGKTKPTSVTHKRVGRAPDQQPVDQKKPKRKSELRGNDVESKKSRDSKIYLLPSGLYRRLQNLTESARTACPRQGTLVSSGTCLSARVKNRLLARPFLTHNRHVWRADQTWEFNLGTSLRSRA